MSGVLFSSKFYQEGEGQSDLYIVHAANVTVGQYCAALFDGLWHRAIIIEVHNLERANIFYIDFGTKLDVLQSELRYLHSQFAELPAQGIKVIKWKSSFSSHPRAFSNNSDSACRDV